MATMVIIMDHFMDVILESQLPDPWQIQPWSQEMVHARRLYYCLIFTKVIVIQ